MMIQCATVLSPRLFFLSTLFHFLYKRNTPYGQAKFMHEHPMPGSSGPVPSPALAKPRLRDLHCGLLLSQIRSNGPAKPRKHDSNDRIRAIPEFPGFAHVALQSGNLHPQTWDMGFGANLDCRPGPGMGRGVRLHESCCGPDRCQC
jgi:hypothetical protein